jgi:hypothetical protein
MRMLELQYHPAAYSDEAPPTWGHEVYWQIALTGDVLEAKAQRKGTQSAVVEQTILPGPERRDISMYLH